MCIGPFRNEAPMIAKHCDARPVPHLITPINPNGRPVVRS